MKKRFIIASAALCGAYLLLWVLALCGRGTPVSVTGNLTQQDVAAIRRDYGRLQRQNVSKALVSADPLFLLGSLKDLALGRVREIGGPLDGCGVVRAGYVWSSCPLWVCDLVRSTNGWRLP